MKKRRNLIKSYILFVVVFIIILLTYGIYLLSNKNDTKSLLINKSYNIIYTSYEDKVNEKQVPAVNIKGISKEINTNINNFVSPYIDKKTNRIYYLNEINGNILSLIIVIENYEKEGPADYKYLSYNINLKELKVLSNQDIYKLFGISDEYLLRMFYDKFKIYYEDSINKGIIKSNVSYDNYLKSHEITNFINESYYYISNSKLHVYLDYNEWTSDETENYYVSIGHDFEIE